VIVNVTSSCYDITLHICITIKCKMAAMVKDYGPGTERRGTSFYFQGLPIWVSGHPYAMKMG